MKKILLITWDGAGNVAPMFAVAQRLVAAGHEVRLLGPLSLGMRARAIGCEFVAFTHHAEWTSMVNVDLADEFNILATELLCSAELGRDVAAELDRQPADIAVVDAMMLAAITAAQSRVPTVSLFHTAMAIFRGGPLFDLLLAYMSSLNEFRAELGQAAVAAFTEIHDACPLSLVGVAREFEPDFPRPANARYVGPILGGPGLGITRATTPLLYESGNGVLVSFSSSNQGQLDVVRRIALALVGASVETVITAGNAIDPDDIPSASNVHVSGYVPHEELLPSVAAVLSHGGLGTVMAALAHGLPVLCMPMGRDQFFNTAMVERLGVGQAIPLDASPEDIRIAVQTVLQDEGVRASAKRFSGVIAGYPGVEGVLHEIDQLGGAALIGEQP